MNWIQTLDGKKFDLLNPTVDMIDPGTIVMGLSRMCRFSCHCNEFYSVGQHSILVCDLVEEPELKLAALLHDAHELYWGFGDIPRPAKVLFGEEFTRLLSDHATKMDKVIAERFGIDFLDMCDNAKVKHADDVALATEKRDLMGPEPEPWGPLPDPVSDDYFPLHKIDVWSSFTTQVIFNQYLEKYWKPF